MTKFLLVYHGGNAPSSKEEGEKTMAAWGQWIGGLGKALVDVGNPTGAAKTVAPGGKVSNAVDAAVAAVKGCPQLTAGGSIEVTEITPVM